MPPSPSRPSSLRLACAIAFAVAVLAWSAVAAARERSGQVSPDACTPLTAPTPRVRALRDWLIALDQHTPGELDSAASNVSTWSADVFERIRIDASTVATLMRRPQTSAFFIAHRTSPWRPPVAPEPIPYREDEVKAFRAIARHLALHTSANTILLLGAALHTDLALGIRGAPARAHANPRGSPSLHLQDGQLVTRGVAVGHWAVARSLLDNLVSGSAGALRDPAVRDEVRLWYAATLALMHHTGNIDLAHFDRAMQLFPDDPDLLTLTGAVHELLAAPVLRASTGRVVTDSLGARPQADEWRVAERIYRRVLATDPSAAEARVRLGRVVGLLGHHADAYKILAVPSQSADPIVRYYASLFLAGEAGALGRESEARAAYEAAARTFPRAQAPRLGLSELASRAGDWPAAAAAFDLTDRVEPAAEPDDP